MKIGELAKAGGLTPKTIRFYEQAGVLPEPARTPSGYRDYGPEFLDRLGFIRRAQAAGLSLRQIRQILAIHDRGEAPCGHVRDVLGARLDQVRAHLAELVTLEAHLESLLEHARQSEPSEHDASAVCWILETEPREHPMDAHGGPTSGPGGSVATR